MGSTTAIFEHSTSYIFFYRFNIWYRLWFIQLWRVIIFRGEKKTVPDKVYISRLIINFRANLVLRALVDEQLSSVTSDDLNSSNQLLQQREQLLASIESNITVQKLKSQRQLEEMLYRRAEKKVDKVVAEQLQEIEVKFNYCYAV